MSSKDQDQLLLPKITNNNKEKELTTNLSNVNQSKQSLVDSQDINPTFPNNNTQQNINNTESDTKTKNDYEEKISNLKQYITTLEASHSQEISKLNEEIKLKEKNLKSLSLINSSLKKSLTNLTTRLDQIIIKKTNEYNKQNSKYKTEKNINYEEEIKKRDRELKTKQNLLNNLYKENKRLHEEIDQHEAFEENRNLQNLLHEKDQEILKHKKIIKEYEIKLREHDNCEKEIESLQNKLFNNKKELSVQKKEMQLKSKNIAELKGQLSNSTSAINILNKNIKQRNTNNLKLNQKLMNNLQTSNSNINYNNFLNNINNKQRSKLTLSPIEKKIDNNNANTLSNKKTNHKINISNLGNNIIYPLFNEDEKKIIQKLFSENSEKYLDFCRKINILERYKNSKSKAYLMKIKHLENKINVQKEELKYADNTIADRENQIFYLTKQINILMQKQKSYNEKIIKLNQSLDNANKVIENYKKDNINMSNLLFNAKKNNNIQINEIKEEDNSSLKEEKNSSIVINQKEESNKNDNNVNQKNNITNNNSNNVSNLSKGTNNLKETSRKKIVSKTQIDNNKTNIISFNKRKNTDTHNIIVEKNFAFETEVKNIKKVKSNSISSGDNLEISRNISNITLNQKKPTNIQVSSSDNTNNNCISEKDNNNNGTIFANRSKYSNNNSKDKIFKTRTIRKSSTEVRLQKKDRKTKRLNSVCIPSNNILKNETNDIHQENKIEDTKKIKEENTKTSVENDEDDESIDSEVKSQEKNEENKDDNIINN